MAKNYADLYNLTGDSTAVEQRFYLKAETTRGDLLAPTNTDFFFTLAGGTIEFSQPSESSPHRSGRGHIGKIRKKKEQNWSLSTYFNIDTTLGSGGAAEIDQPIRELWKSLLGKEVVSSGLIYTRTTPDFTFSLLECGDRWSRQGRGCFVQQAVLQFPGDGESMIEWSGQGKDALYVGIGKSTINNTGGNTVTVQAADADLFINAVGGLVMIIEADGVTRSTDTPNGSPRKIVSVSGAVVTLDGAALADADGSVALTPVYLCYYEPAAPAAINDPVTGLTGSVTIPSLGYQCIRSLQVTVANDHELRNDCYGEDSAGGSIFVAGSRLTATVNMEMNLNKESFKLLKRVTEFEAQDITIVLGEAAGRRFELALPKVDFSTPTVNVPETGSIPIPFNDGLALQTGLDTKDEITASYL
jgi:hypothetical protein